MLEIERKILNINKQELESKLIALKAHKIFEGIIKTKYFDYPDYTFKNRNELLRLRLINNRTELTFKHDRNDTNRTRTVNEKNIQLEGDQLDKISEFLISIGFIQSMYFEKHRTEYSLSNKKVKFEIDTYPLLPTFVEIEAGSPEIIDEMITNLELQNHEQTPETIAELFKRIHPNLDLNGQTL